MRSAAAEADAVDVREAACYHVDSGKRCREQLFSVRALSIMQSRTKRKQNFDVKFSTCD